MGAGDFKFGGLIPVGGAGIGDGGIPRFGPLVGPWGRPWFGRWMRTVDSATEYTGILRDANVPGEMPGTGMDHRYGKWRSPVHVDPASRRGTGLALAGRPYWLTTMTWLADEAATEPKVSTFRAVELLDA